MADTETLDVEELDQPDADFEYIGHVDDAPSLAPEREGTAEDESLAEEEKNDAKDKTEEPETVHLEPGIQALVEAGIGGENPEHWELAGSASGQWVFDGEKIFDPRTGERYSSKDPETASVTEQEAARQWNEGGKERVVIPGAVEEVEGGKIIHAFQLIRGERREDGTIEVGYEWHRQFVPEEKETEPEKGEEATEAQVTIPSPFEYGLPYTTLESKGKADIPMSEERAHEAQAEYPETTDAESHEENEVSEITAPLVAVAETTPSSGVEIAQMHDTPEYTETAALTKSYEGSLMADSLQFLPVFEPMTSGSHESEFRETSIHEAIRSLLAEDLKSESDHVPTSGISGTHSPIDARDAEHVVPIEITVTSSVMENTKFEVHIPHEQSVIEKDGLMRTRSVERTEAPTRPERVGPATVGSQMTRRAPTESAEVAREVEFNDADNESGQEDSGIGNGIEHAVEILNHAREIQLSETSLREKVSANFEASRRVRAYSPRRSNPPSRGGKRLGTQNGITLLRM